MQGSQTGFRLFDIHGVGIQPRDTETHLCQIDRCSRQVLTVQNEVGRLYLTVLTLYCSTASMVGSTKESLRNNLRRCIVFQPEACVKKQEVIIFPSGDLQV